MDTRERIIAAARSLFWTQGYHATSVNDVLQLADAGSGSLYHFFDGKEDLLVAVLESYLDLLDEEVVDPAFARSDDPVERVFNMLEGYRVGLLETGFDFACPIGRLALEMANAPERVRGLIAENFNRWCDVIERCLDEAEDRFPPALDRPGLARFVLTTMEGAVMQAATQRRIAPFDSSVAHLRAYLDGLTESASSFAQG